MGSLTQGSALKMRPLYFRMKNRDVIFATVDYNLTPLFDDREMVPAVLEKGADEPAVLLYYCQGQEISRKNLGIFQKLVLSPAFTDEYKRLIRKRSWIIIRITCRKIWMPVWR